MKGIEKKIIAQHKQCAKQSEVEAKVNYCQFCRSLKTYGITFFLVKERVKGKSKLVPRLLGINKDSVVRVDERTKDIIKTWPLTTVKRWAASPNSFTLVSERLGYSCSGQTRTRDVVARGRLSTTRSPDRLLRAVTRGRPLSCPLNLLFD